MAAKLSILIDCPLAHAGGILIASATQIDEGPTDLEEAFQVAKRSGRPVFIGVALTDREAKAARQKLEEAAAEAVATVYRGGR